jgi:hypothetical protein
MMKSKMMAGGGMKKKGYASGGMPKGGMTKMAAGGGVMSKMKAGGGATKMGAVKTSSKPDGVAMKGKTKGKMIAMRGK